MARDRPSPYDEGNREIQHGDVSRPSVVARGPVPRDRCMARDRPSPYGNIEKTPPNGMARDRPSPYGNMEKRLFFNVLSDFLDERRAAHAEQLRCFTMIARKCL